MSGPHRAAHEGGDATGAGEPTRDPLDRLTHVAAEVGATGLEARIEAFRQRIAAGRFYVACVGEFKRGKSTLVNALLDRSVLPMGLVPVTTVPTVVEYGADASVRVEFAHGNSQPAAIGDLATYVSEAGNPRNARGVEAVRVFVPSPLLAGGLCLVDTPGLGAVFGEGAAATRAFIPQVDAALVVLGADPPVSAEEVALVKAVAKQVRHLIVVLNKADRFSDAERAEAVRYAADILAAAVGRPFERILEVSAIERLAGGGPPRDWDVLVRALAALSTRSADALVRSAFDRGVVRLARQCLREVNEAHGALFRPWDESDRRVAGIRSRVAHIAYDDLTLGFRMRREEDAMRRAALDRRREFLAGVSADAGAKLARELARALNSARRLGRGAMREAAYRCVRAVAERILVPWIEAEQRAAEAWYRQATDGLLDAARALLAGLAAFGELGPGDLSGELDSAEHYRVAGASEAGRFPLPEPARGPRRWGERLVPGRWIRRALEREVGAYLELALADGARLVEDGLGRRIEESHARLARDVRQILDSVYESADRATTRALAVRSRGNEAMYAELRRLELLRREIAAVADVAVDVAVDVAARGDADAGAPVP